jgi:hypothetical protein
MLVQLLSPETIGLGGYATLVPSWRCFCCVKESARLGIAFHRQWGGWCAAASTSLPLWRRRKACLPASNASRSSWMTRPLSFHSYRVYRFQTDENGDMLTVFRGGSIDQTMFPDTVSSQTAPSCFLLLRAEICSFVGHASAVFRSGCFLLCQSQWRCQSSSA